MANQPSQAPIPPTPPPSPETGPARPASRIDRLRGRVDAVATRITSDRRVRPALDVIGVANDTGATLFAAALAFGTMFAFIPLVLLVSGVIGWLVDDPVQRASLLDQLVGVVPPLADFFRSSLEGAVAGRGALSIVGVIGLLWGASAFYGVLDEVMRRIFSGGGLRGELSRRIRGFATIAILLVVIIVTVLLGSIWAWLDQLVGNLVIWRYAGPLVTLGVMVLVALAVYLIVPTKPPSLRAALPAAVAAGVGIGVLTNLFGLLAPLLIGSLSGFGIIATVFGALVWLNLGYQILLFGAAWARLRRDRENPVSPDVA
ncbi:MAG TPA: YihY/virulence factor BrkB family protein [Candidatus Limnocylindria bacterium]|nr:YihY/virulence factor BrkB family protein [Candidatus Limnocylindria bacterium]